MSDEREAGVEGTDRGMPLAERSPARQRGGLLSAVVEDPGRSGKQLIPLKQIHLIP